MGVQFNYIALFKSLLDMRFDDIEGAFLAKNHLCKLVASNRLPHALLFDTHEGTGGLSLAIAFAQYLACKEPLEHDSCGQCARCQRMAKGALSDVHFIMPEPGASKADSNEFIEAQNAALQTLLASNPYFTEQQWYAEREQAGKQGLISAAAADRLIEQLAYRPYELDFRIVIVWLPERMNTAAANRLLKIIEEPPMGAVFLFVSENVGEILPTIRSRLQRVVVPPISPEDIEHGLIARQNATPQDAQRAARIAMGSYARALELLNANDHDEDLALFKQLTQAAYRNAYLELADWAFEIARLDRETLKALIEYFAGLFRAGFMLNIQQPSLCYASPNETEFLENFAPYINGRNVGFILYELSSLLEHLQRNGNTRILLTDFSLRLANLIGAKIV